MRVRGQGWHRTRSVGPRSVPGNQTLVPSANLSSEGPARTDLISNTTTTIMLHKFTERDTLFRRRVPRLPFLKIYVIVRRVVALTQQAHTTPSRSHEITARTRMSIQGSQWGQYQVFRRLLSVLHFLFHQFTPYSDVTFLGSPLNLCHLRQIVVSRLLRLTLSQSLLFACNNRMDMEKPNGYIRESMESKESTYSQARILPHVCAD
jgi:hypothetical protein